MQRLFIIFILLIWSRTSIGQQIDSLYKLVQQTKSDSAKSRLLGDLAYLISNNNPDSALKLDRLGVTLAKKNSYRPGEANCLQSMGWAYYRKGKNDSAIYFINQATAIFHDLKRRLEEGKCLKNLGSVYSATKDYPKAFAALIPAKKLFEEIHDERLAAYIDKEMGGIYRQTGVLNLARQYLGSAIETFERLHDNAYLGDALSAYGSVFWAMKDYDSALYFYRKEYSIYLTLPALLSNQAYAAENIAYAYLAKCKEKNTFPWADSAIFFFSKAQDIFTKMKDTTDIFFEKMNVGTVLSLKQDYKTASTNLFSALTFFQSIKDSDDVHRIYDELRKIYRAEGDYKTAYAFLDSASILNDSLVAKDNRFNITDMFAKYETDKKDRTILLLNTQQKLYQQQISRQHILAILIVSVALFGVFIGLVLWNRRGIKQKLKELEMRNQLSSDLHDDIGSSLSSILLLSTMAAQKQDDPVIHNKLLEKINNNAKEVIDRMSDIVWTMNPKFDEGDSLHEKLENYITRLKEITPINITGNIDDKIDRIHFTMELRKNIFLIIKEAMNNALKHASATLLQLDINIKEKHFEVVITDNGIGFEKAETQGGNGFETMINRAKASNGDCRITSFLGRGTVVKAVIPIPHIR